MDINPFLRQLTDQEATDLFLKVGNRPFLRRHGTLVPLEGEALTIEQITVIVGELMGPHQRQQFYADRELNFAFERASIGRFRANLMWQKGTVALVIRRVQHLIPSFEALHLPAEVLKRLARESQGLVLITGSTDAGKSTTAAAMLEFINQTSAMHIVTLEDPIEYQFDEAQAIINQREIGGDTRSFSEGLKNVLRQSPDVLFVSDIRERETMEAALLASEAGQLVISCVHTTNVVTTIERIIAFFPAHEHGVIRLRLSQALRGVISQRLVLRQDGQGRMPVCEILVATPTVRELIREGQTVRLPGVMEEGSLFGMQTFTQALYWRLRQKEIAWEEARRAADSPEALDLAMKNIRPIRDT
jgi:twitching motility protein PilT